MARRRRLHSDRVPGVDRVGRGFYHLVALRKVAEDFHLSIYRLPRLHGDPFRLVITNADDKGMLLIVGHGRSRNKERGISALERPLHGGEAAGREFAIVIHYVELYRHGARLLVERFGDAGDRSF